MLDYEALDLTELCNVGTEVFTQRGTPLVGDQSFHGLPFRIGSEAGKPCYLGFGTAPDFYSSAQTKSIGRTARWVIFAHTLFESKLDAGDPVGRIVARYRFHMQGGSVIEAPVRERFEIAGIPTSWGTLPFLAVPDGKDTLYPRNQGRWEESGHRLKEVGQAIPMHYYLWAWENPTPEIPIESVEILPGSAAEPDYLPRMIVAGITLSRLAEDPFLPRAGVPVKLTLPNAEDSAEPFSLQVEVDRGVATYPYPLTREAEPEFLADPLRGFGEGKSNTNSPAYVEISATPSATVTVKKEDAELGHTTWGELESHGVVETERVRFELVETGRNWVHTTVVDDATGKPIPCRIHFRSPHGIPYAPHGHHAHVHSDLGSWHVDVGGDVRLGQISYAYIDGKCQGWLPRGEVIVDVARGFEYQPERVKVEILPGQRELTLRLKRIANMNAERYFSGDTHVHFLSTQGAITEAAAEDLDVVNLLLSQWGHLYTNTEEFIGKPVSSGDGETIVYATQENRQHLLGHLTLLGLKEPVMPWCTDGPGEAEMGGNLEITLSHWADACHAQGGTVVIPHLPNPNGEPAALIATGRADAVEMLIHSPFFHTEYYRYLNGGYRLPLAGGTDKMDSGVPVGLYRTYAYIPPDEAFNYENWCKALRSGNTFLSGGPLLTFTVNGEPIGSTLTLGNDGGTVELVATAKSALPIHCLEIVQGGEVVARVEESDGTTELRLQTTLKISKTTWLCARCGGPNYTVIRHHDSWQRGIMAHTSPIYLSCGATYDLCHPATLHYMLTLVDGSLQYIRKRAPQWKPGTVTHHHGQDDHLAFLESPFHEAVHAIHKKMHEHGIAH